MEERNINDQLETGGRMEEVSLFSSDSDSQYGDYETLEVISCSYLDVWRKQWEALFEGYDELYAITFSSGIDFTARLISKFEYAEIIYGCKDIINSNVASIIAAQRNIIETISKSKAINTIANRVGEKQLKLFVSMDTNSHEKIYILRSKEGKTRVITGSANMSASAFNGLQREEILCFDDALAYDYFFDRFEKFRERCSNRIDEDVINAVIADKEYLREHIEKTPYLEEAQKRVKLDITKSEDEEDYMADVRNIEKEIKDLLPRGKNGKNTISITAEDVNIIRRNSRDYFDSIKREKQSPVLHLDMEKEEISFGKKKIDLNPDPELVKKDAEGFTRFIDGFKVFNGNYLRAQEDYFSYLNWFFCSIFVPRLRQLAYRKGYSIFYFPMFGIICGPSNAGTTKLVEMLSKMMTGESIIPSGSDVFNSREIDKLRRNCEGVPIMIEDLAKQQYEANYEKIIKDDYYGMSENRVNYPAISITANKIQSLTQDATKRAVYFRTDITTDKETGVKNAKMVNDSIASVTSALFGEYARRMIPVVKEMENRMMDGSQDYSPDILNESSKVLVEIFSENLSKCPKYIRELSYGDYFGDSIIGRTAIERVMNAWRHQKDNFSINRKDNKLTYTIPDSASYELGYLVNELPSSLNAKKLGGMLTMDLDKANEVFGIRFRKGLFDR